MGTLTVMAVPSSGFALSGFSRRMYTEQGRLLGHPAMGSRMISEAALKLGLSNEKILPLQNAVLHHHNNGDRAQEHCLEGKMLQMIDVLDSCASAGGPPAGRTNVA